MRTRGSAPGAAGRDESTYCLLLMYGERRHPSGLFLPTTTPGSSGMATRTPLSNSASILGCWGALLPPACSSNFLRRAVLRGRAEAMCAPAAKRRQGSAGRLWHRAAAAGRTSARAECRAARPHITGTASGGSVARSVAAWGVCARLGTGSHGSVRVKAPAQRATGTCCAVYVLCRLLHAPVLDARCVAGNRLPSAQSMHAQVL